MKWPSEIHQNLPYFWNTKTKVLFVLFFSFCAPLFRKKIRVQEKKMKKTTLYLGFLIPNIWQILKRFTGTFYQGTFYQVQGTFYQGTF